MLDVMSEGPYLGSIPHAVVMQPHTLCPLDCSYCYLPARRMTHRMLPATAEAVAASVNWWFQGAPDEGFSVLWHAGEPLALGVNHLAGLIRPFDSGIIHAVQTAAIHISELWCDYFEQIGMRVGVSLDGPREMNASRKLLGGQEAWGRAVEGCKLLRRRGIEFHVIAVVSDPDPADARRLLDFFADLGAASLAINVEETEGINKAAARDPQRITAFWCALFDNVGDFPGLRLRDVQKVADHLAGRGARVPRTGQGIDPFPTVSYSGDVTLVSPELSSFSDPHYGQFSSGNVLDTPLDEIVARGNDVPWIRDFLAGVRNCAGSCSLFEFCGGGEPSNKHFEGVGLSGTVTAHCTNTRMALLQGALDSATRKAR